MAFVPSDETVWFGMYLKTICGIVTDEEAPIVPAKVGALRARKSVPYPEVEEVNASSNGALVESLPGWRKSITKSPP